MNKFLENIEKKYPQFDMYEDTLTLSIAAPGVSYPIDLMVIYPYDKSDVSKGWAVQGYLRESAFDAHYPECYLKESIYKKSEDDLIQLLDKYMPIYKDFQIKLSYFEAYAEQLEGAGWTRWDVAEGEVRYFINTEDLALTIYFPYVGDDDMLTQYSLSLTDKKKHRRIARWFADTLDELLNQLNNESKTS